MEIEDATGAGPLVSSSLDEAVVLAAATCAAGDTPVGVPCPAAVLLPPRAMPIAMPPATSAMPTPAVIPNDRFIRVKLRQQPPYLNTITGRRPEHC